MHLLTKAGTQVENSNRQTPEGVVQSEIEVDAPVMCGGVLWRNNRGAANDPVSGRPVRYGLANTSKAMGDRIRTGDLVGPMPMLITPQHVGRTVGIFGMVEVKKADWQFGKCSGKKATHEQAQLRALTIVNSCGGFGIFANSVASVRAAWGAFIQ
jgi:hypothetical protein